MANLVDYVRWRGDLTLSQSPLNEVDYLILTQIILLDFREIIPGDGESIPLSDAAARYFHSQRDRAPLGLLTPAACPELLSLCAESDRFRAMRLSAFVDRIDEERQEQFCAMTVEPGDGSVLIVYRGTDDTLVGWREDFNLCWKFPIPAQDDALTYLLRCADRFPVRPIQLCGHSKGGNLSIYAAVHAAPQLQRRIVSVYSFDGPGFRIPLQETAAYARVKERIRAIIPQSSLIGMLLEHSDDYTVVRSSETGLQQHDAFSWEVLGSRLVALDRVTDYCAHVERTLREWLESMDDRQRKTLVDDVFGVLTATGAKTLSDLNADKLGFLRRLLEALNTLDPSTREKLREIIRMLLTPMQFQKRVSS